MGYYVPFAREEMGASATKLPAREPPARAHVAVTKIFKRFGYKA